MDDKENYYTDPAARARLKRRNVLQQKRINRQNINLRSTQRTPLSKITSRTQNEQLPTDTQYTQPSSSLNSSCKKRSRLGNHSIGLNLIKRFHQSRQNCTDECVSNQPPNLTDANAASLCSSTPVIGVQAEFNERCDVVDLEEGDQFKNGSESSDEDELVTNADVVQIAEYSDLGDPLMMCQYCEALMWYQERMRKHRHTPNPKFHLCCGDGKVQLPFLRTPPPVLEHLLFDKKSDDSKNFQQHIRTYNMMFAFTSPGVKLDRSINNGRGPPNVRIQGQACH